MSFRALVPTSFSKAPFLPMTIPFWESLSTIIVAWTRIISFSVSSSFLILSITTAIECGISSRVKCSTFSRINSEMIKRSG